MQNVNKKTQLYSGYMRKNVRTMEYVSINLWLKIDNLIVEGLLEPK